MKKLLLVLISAVFLLTIVGCGCEDTVVCNGEHVEEILSAKAPTCKEDGLTEGKKCAICDDIIVMQEIIPRLSHTYEDDYECIVCGEVAKESEGLDFELDTKTNTYTFVGVGECTDKKIVIPIKYNDIDVTKIKAFALYNNEAIEELTISKNITLIEDYALSNCTSLKRITVSTKNEAFKSADGSLYTKNGKKLVQYALGKAEASVKLLDTVEEIGSCAFAGNQYLKEISFGDNVKIIGVSAFVNCHYIESVSLGKVEKIGDNAFYGCAALTEITIPKTVTEMGQGVFYGCVGLNVFCEAQERPSGWSEYWNDGNFPVIWGKQ